MSEVKCENYDCIKVMCIFIRFTAESIHIAVVLSAANFKTKILNFLAVCFLGHIPNKKAAKVTY